MKPRGLAHFPAIVLVVVSLLVVTAGRSYAVMATPSPTPGASPTPVAMPSPTPITTWRAQELDPIVIEGGSPEVTKYLADTLSGTRSAAVGPVKPSLNGRLPSSVTTTLFESFPPGS